MSKHSLAPTPTEKTAKTKQLIWDLPTRIFHWLLAVFIIAAYVCAKFAPPLFYWHAVFGVGTGLLILWRIIWGFIGSRHARFASLRFSPLEVGNYVRSVLSGRGHYYAAHNPASALVIWIMLLLAGFTVVSGAFSSIEALEDLHKVAANVLMLLILVHVAGVLVAAAMNRENYTWAMITGRKKADAVESINGARPVAAIFMLAFVIGGMAYFAGGLNFTSGEFNAPWTQISFHVGE